MTFCMQLHPKLSEITKPASWEKSNDRRRLNFKNKRRSEIKLRPPNFVRNAAMHFERLTVWKNSLITSLLQLLILLPKLSIVPLSQFTILESTIQLEKMVSVSLEVSLVSFFWSLHPSTTICFLTQLTRSLGLQQSKLKSSSLTGWKKGISLKALALSKWRMSFHSEFQMVKVI